MQRYSVTCVAIGMGSHSESCEGDSMDDVLAAWLRISPTTTTAFKSYPLTPSYSSTNFAGRAVHHGSELGRWYCLSNRLDGPAHHSQGDWEVAIERALAERGKLRPRRHEPHPPLGRAL